MKNKNQNTSHFSEINIRELDHHPILNDMMEISSNVILILDTQARIIKFNPFLKELTGYTDAELSGKDLFSLLPATDHLNRIRDFCLDRIDEKLNGVIVPILTKSGQRVVIEWNGKRLRDFKNQLIGLLLVGKEISAKEDFSRDLVIGEEKVNALINNIKTGIIVYAPDTTIIKCNVTVCDLLGVSEEDILGKSINQVQWNFIREDGSSIPANELPIRIVLSEKKILHDYVMGIVNPKRKNVVWVLVNGVPEFDGMNQIRNVFITFVDITDRRQAEEAFRQTYRKLRGILTHSPALISIFNNQGKYLMVSHSFQEVFKLPLHKIAGSSFNQIFPLEIAKSFQKRIKKMLRTQKPIDVEDQLMVNRKKCIFHTLLFPLDESYKSQKLFCGIMTDITKRKRVDEKLNKYRQQLEKLVKERTDGLSKEIEEHKNTEIALKRSLTRLKLLNNISSRLISGMSVYEIIEYVITQIFSAFPEFRASYSTINSKGMVSILYSVEPQGMPKLTGNTIDLTAVPAYRELLLKNDPVVFTDVLKEQMIKPLHLLFKEAKIRGIVNIPLFHTGGLVGLLCFHSPEPRQWNSHEIDNLKEIARYLSIALSDKQVQEEQRRAEEELKKSKEKYSDLVEMLQEGIWRLDAEGFTTYVNKIMAKMLGYRVSEMMGLNLSMFLDKESQTNAIKLFKRRKTRIKKQQEFCFIRKNKKELYALVSVTPLYNHLGDFDGILTAVMDITNRKFAEEELKKHAQELEAFNKAMVDREIRIIEMKEEVNLLCQELGQDIKYPPVWNSDQ